MYEKEKNENRSTNSEKEAVCGDIQQLHQRAIPAES